MPYALIPNLLVIAALVGLVVLIARRLPEAREMPDTNQGELPGIRQNHIPGSLATSRLYAWLKRIVLRIGDFMMEAKGIHVGAGVTEQVRKIFVRSGKTVLVGRRPKSKVGDAPAKPQQEPVVSDDPETNFLAAIKKNPKDYASYSKLGQLYLDAHNFEEAKKIYSHLVKHQPQNSAFFAKLGFSTLQLGLYQQAAIAYEQALGLDDTQPSRYYNLSLALMAQSKYREAMRAVQKALHLDPHSQKYQQALVQLVRLQQEQTQTDQQQPTHP